jgi:hypothetical protein
MKLFLGFKVLFYLIKYKYDFCSDTDWPEKSGRQLVGVGNIVREMAIWVEMPHALRPCVKFNFPWSTMSHALAAPSSIPGSTHAWALAAPHYLSKTVITRKFFAH